MERSLELGEAVLCAHVLAAHLAQQCGVRALAIKGPVSDYYDFRTIRTPSDADILVEPAGFGTLVDHLRRCGWKERSQSVTSRRLTMHSLTLVHAQWPCDIDVHSSWPGALKSAATVLSATLEKWAIATGENEATQTDWVDDHSGRLGIDQAAGCGWGSAASGCEAVGDWPVDGRAGVGVGAAAEV